MIRLLSYFFLFFCISLFTSCNKDGNLVGPGNPPVWTQEQLQSLEVRGVCATGNVIIAGAYQDYTSNACFFRSTDNGVTWARTDSFSIQNHSPNQSLWTIPSLVFQTDGTEILAGIGGGLARGDIYISTDGGLTWKDNGVDWPESGKNGTENIEDFCISGGTIFAGTDEGVFLSTNHGASWKNTDDGFTTPVEGIGAVGLNVFAATEGEGIYRSSDNGSNWALADSENYIFKSLVPIGSDIFAGAFQFYDKPYTGGVFLSTDKGANWAHSDSGLANHEVNVLIASGSYLFAGTNLGIYVSLNAGADWTFASTGSPADSMTVLSLAVNSTQLVIGTSNGVWCCPLSGLENMESETNQLVHKNDGG